MTATSPTEPAPGASAPLGTSPDPAERRRLGTTDLALVAAFAALTSAVAYVGAVPVGGAGVAITLQTFAVMLAGVVLGPLRGFLAIALYLVLGAVGLPVFSEHSSGLGVFTGASAGYLLSFPLAALVGGLMVKYVAGESGKTRAAWVFLCALAGNVLVIHPLGILGMKLFFDVSFLEAAGYDLPFWLGDLIKASLVALVAAEVHRAFPRLLPARRSR